jgi:hypothetical protein
MMRNGQCFLRQPSGFLTRDSVSGSLPTPNAGDVMQAKMKYSSIFKACLINGGQMHLDGWLRMQGVETALYPVIYEMVMGYPISWTALEDSGTR